MKEQTEKTLGLVSFTPGGQIQAGRVRELLKQPLGKCRWSVKYAHKPNPVQEWCKEQFEICDAILFVGAMGIAVRTVAPFLQSKVTDPAVLVMDEQGKYMISMLSGHIGGGNELARILAAELGAEPVITTASDVNKKIAIDVFAKKNQLMIADMKQAKETAAAIVAGKPVSFSCEGKVYGQIPPELSAGPAQAKMQVVVTPREKEEQQKILHLIPKAYVLGIGCRKGKTLEEIETRVFEELHQYEIAIESIQSVATIELKREEQGLLDFCEKYKFPITFYTAEELQQVPGTYPTSEFVKSVAGVDNVCERATMRKVWEEYRAEESKEGTSMEDRACIRIKKSGRNGVTVALAERDWSVEFE